MRQIYLIELVMLNFQEKLPEISWLLIRKTILKIFLEPNI